MDKNKTNDNALKQALKQRVSGSLPSNFSCRMMEKVRHEALKQKRRKQRLVWLAALGVMLVPICLLISYLVVYSNIQCPEFQVTMHAVELSSPLWSFSIYIAILVLFLLGLDHWFRKRSRKQS